MMSATIARDKEIGSGEAMAVRSRMKMQADAQILISVKEKVCFMGIIIPCQ